MATETCPIERWENFPARVFGRVYVVNLARRADRWESFRARVPEDWPFEWPERFEAVDGAKCPPPPWWTQGAGAWGCYRSHLAIMERCLNDGVESVLILEDDAVFVDDFATRAVESLAEVPDDWGMLYLGGQHFKTVPPVAVNEHVVKPANVQRTHAYALRGQTLRDVYRFLSDTQSETWKPRHHVDHRLGVFLETSDAPAYAVARWLVGQNAGHSDISGADEKSVRWWSGSAKTVKWKPFTPTKPIVAVVGPYRSGTSAVAGILHTLGVSMGERLRPGGKSNPRGTFEAVALGNLCRSWFREPQLTPTSQPAARVVGLRKWRADRERVCQASVIGAKHPILSVMVADVLAAWPDARIIVTDRPASESDASALKWGGYWKKHAKGTARRMIDAREAALTDATAAVLRIDYHAMLSDPAATIDRVIEFIGLDVPADRRKAAIDTIDPGLCHHDHRA